MQRILRETGNSQGTILASAYDEKVSIIKSHFPPSIAAAYAIPRQGADGVLEWWTDLRGLVQPYRDLSPTQQTQLLAAYEAQQQAVGKLADELERRGDDVRARHARSLIGPADKDSLYSAEGAPLLTRWAAAPAPVAAAAPPPSPPPRPPAPIPAAPASRRWLWWLLPLLLLLLLAWLWFLWSGRKNPAPQALAEPICTEIVDPTPEQAQKIPEFAVILDTSRSMELNVSTPVELEEKIFTAFKRARASVFTDIKDEELQPWIHGPSRATVAIQTLDSVLGELPRSVATQLYTFDQKEPFFGCQRPKFHGTFGSSERPQLTALLQKMQFIGATPLAATLSQAASSMDGKDRDGVVLMFVDGEDGCNQNICKVAASIAETKPRLTVNVVDISGAGLANCVAEATGGKVYASKNAVELTDMLKEASATVRKAAMVCKPK